MRSVVRIAHGEVRHHWRSGQAPILGVLIGAIFLASAFVGWRHHERLNAQRARYQDIVVDEWEAQPDRHPHRVSHYGFLVFRPKPPLSVFDFGIDSYTGTSLFLEAHRQNTANFSEARHASGMLRFGEMSPAQVLQVLVPLLVFFVASNAIPREREGGTLSLLLTQGVRFRELLWGKALGVFATVASWTVPAAGVALLALSIATAWQWTPELWGRVAILAAGYGAYLWICAAGAVVVSAFHRSSRGSLTTLLAIWIALWVVLPRALPSIGEALHPSPSKAAFDAALEADLKQVGDSHNPDDPFFQALQERTLASHGVSELAELPVNYKGIVMLEAEKNTAEIFRKHHGALMDTYRRQNRLLEIAEWVDPLLAIRSVSMAAAGTDFEHHERFQDSAESYRFDLVQQLNALHVEEVAYARDVYVRPGSGPPTRQRIDKEHFAELPELDFRPPTVAGSLAPHRSALWALLAWSLLVALGLTARNRAGTQ